jgi:Pyridoxamine 5'-phosphate oxidase
MADSSLSVRDRELFLAEPHVAALSVSAGQGRGPFTVPIWYQYVPGGEAWVLTEAGSRKARLIETAGRITLMVDRVMPTVRYVSVEGPVMRTIPGTDELLRVNGQVAVPGGGQFKVPSPRLIISWSGWFLLVLGPGACGRNRRL